MVYSIVGPDGKEYGPVDINGLIQWVKEGRVAPGTQVVEHATMRRFLAKDLAELAPLFSAPPVVAASAVYTPPSGGLYFQAPGALKVGPDGRPLKSKMTAGLLGIFLGGFGAHRFYLGYTAIGVIQLVVSLVTCGVGSIWGLIEGILCLTGSMTDAEGRPLTD